METPLLALTRRRGGAVLEGAATETMRQLAQLRWIAVAGQTATILAVRYGLGVTLPVAWMLAATALLGLANLSVVLALPHRRMRNVEIGLVLLLDMAVLTFQLYCSGGATNPFIPLYLLQVVLGAILLPPARAAVLAIAASACFALLSLLALPLDLPDTLLPIRADLFAIGRWLSFVLVAGLLVLFITRISRDLRSREAYLADLRQRAAEEEGIVRMGLFASGAAHELGTPLGSLAVILADWRRMPTVTADPELAAEVAEMQAEVQRCKAIVTDILHSAGQPRSEPLERVAASAFVAAVAEEWRPTRPDAAFTIANATGATTIIAEPALRQAIWSLLDNAAEASPAGLALETRIEGEMLAIAVSDRGPGFAPAALRHVGKLYQSTKGAGHGLGLFLATNLARRLGGRLKARNRDGGGAEVTLLLPLARQDD